MSEKSTSGVVSNVLEISDLAAKVSVRLFALSRKIRDALKPIEALSKDIASTGAVLNQLAHQLKKDEDVRVGSTTLATSMEDLVEECSSIFLSIDKALDGNNTGSKPILGLQHYVHVTSLEPQLVAMETNLEKLKTPLVLMLQVLIYAEQLKTHQDKTIIKEQQQLIKDLNEERKAHDSGFKKLNGLDRHSSGESGTSWVAEKELPPTPRARSSRSSRSEIPKAGKRVWIRDESPGAAEKPISRSGSGTGRFRNSVRIPSRFANDADDQRSSLLDMANFLRSTGPDTVRSSRVSSEDTRALSANNSRSRPRYEPRDPVIRGDSSDLISFFREGLPASEIVRTAPALTPLGPPPVRYETAPMTPPPTGIDDGRQATSPSHPAQFAPVQIRGRSQSARFHSPLGSHPPVRQLDPSRPATTKWPLQAVIAWLEANSFSQEWQDTFRTLQIWGSEFVELESGQSIRKMLTVIYPQMAKEYSASGNGWDQARERAEGQRLRNLIRELPVEIKYEDEVPQTPVDEAEFKGNESNNDPGIEARGPTRFSRRPDLDFPTGRQRASTAPPQDTFFTDQVLEAPFRPKVARISDDMTFLAEQVEDEGSEADEEKNYDQRWWRRRQQQQQQHQMQMQMHTPIPQSTATLDPRHMRKESEMSNLSTEWVQEWTVLSPGEIARGRDTAPALMI